MATKNLIMAMKNNNLTNLIFSSTASVYKYSGKILNEKIFENIWIQPAAGDAGGSLGAALAYWHRDLKKPRNDYKDQMNGSYLGPKFNDDEILKYSIVKNEVIPVCKKLI